MSRIDGPQSISNKQIQYLPEQHTLYAQEKPNSPGVHGNINPEDIENKIYNHNIDGLTTELQEIQENKNNKGFWDKFKETVMPEKGEYVNNNPPKEYIDYDD